MHILPSSYEQFSTREYWQSFFKNRPQTFEWYGSYADFKSQLFYAFASLYNGNNRSPAIQIFHIGCGNSAFCQQIVSSLPMYQFTVLNCDSSQLALKQAAQRAHKTYTSNQMQYAQINMLKELPLEYHGKFKIAVDKGTLDALLSKDDYLIIESIKKDYFRNVQQSLKKQAEVAFIIITMLQEYILRTILQYFRFKHTLIIRQSKIKDSAMQPFFVQIIINKPKENVVIKYLDGRTIEVGESKDIIRIIKQMQQSVAISHKLQKLDKGQITSFSIQNNAQEHVYDLYILDTEQYNILKQNTCAVFILSLHMSKQFKTQQQYRQILELVKASRVIIAKMSPQNKSKSLEQIKTDLSPIVRKFVQKDCATKDIPFLADSQQLKAFD